jgi:hypothetical protein
VISTELLRVYLDDHLAGSLAAIDLIKHSIGQNEGTPLADFLQALLLDIEADQQTLQELMASFDIQPSRPKQAASWLAEKVSRIKFDKRLTGSVELSRVLELEALAMGVGGKLNLWQALKAIAGADSRLAGTDLDRLIDRAEQQLEGLESRRLEAVARAFAA